jgi:hypothetical protein
MRSILSGGRTRARLSGCLPIVIAAVAVTGHPGRALAQSGVCGPQTLRGLYVYSATGHNIVGGVAQPKTLIEFIDFSGDGTVTIPAGTLSTNGELNHNVVFRGVYALLNVLQGSGRIGLACKGTVTLIPGPSFDLYTDHTGTQVWMIQTTPGTVFQGAVTKVTP